MGAGWWDGPLASEIQVMSFFSPLWVWFLDLVCVVWQGNKKNWGGSFLGVFLKRHSSVVHLLYLPAQGNSTTCFVYTTICLSELFVHLQLFDKWEKSLIRCLLFSRPFCQQDKNAPVAKFPREPMTWHRSRLDVKWDLGYMLLVASSCKGKSTRHQHIAGVLARNEVQLLHHVCWCRHALLVRLLNQNHSSSSS